MKHRWKIMRIDWLDSMNRAGWHEAEEHKNLLHHSVGFVVEENKHRITITSCAQTNGESVRSAITIPKGCIVKMKVIGKFEPPL